MVEQRQQVPRVHLRPDAVGEPSSHFGLVAEAAQVGNNQIEVVGEGAPSPSSHASQNSG